MKLARPAPLDYPVKMAIQVEIRETGLEDVAIFHAQHAESARGAVTPPDRFEARWRNQLADPAMLIRTVTVFGAVAGYVACFDQEGTRSIAFWLGREFQRRGIGTQAAAALLAAVKERPLYARAAADNQASLRLLARCGFAEVGRGVVAMERGAIEEVTLRLA